MTKAKKKKNSLRVVLLIPLTLISFMGCSKDGDGDATASSITDTIANILPDISDNLDGIDSEISEVINDQLEENEDVLDQISKVEEEEINDEVKQEMDNARNDDDNSSNEDHKDEVLVENEDLDEGETENDLNEDHLEDAPLYEIKAATDRLKNRRKKWRQKKKSIQAGILIRVDVFKQAKTDLRNLRAKRELLLKLIKSLRIEKKGLNKEQRTAINSEIKDIRELEISPLQKKIKKLKKVRKKLHAKVKKLRKRVKKVNQRLKRLNKRLRKNKKLMANPG